MAVGNLDKQATQKSPKDATPFEGEQLRFFLSNGDLAATLSEVNPPLAWLSVLSEMKLVQAEAQLAPWIAQNFPSIKAVRDVIDNIQFFGPETADFLEYVWNSQSEDLPPLLKESWSLIIRHMRGSRASVAPDEWFRIAPQLGGDNHSAALLERLANALRPRLKVGPRFFWHRSADAREPEGPADLMSIDFEVHTIASSDDVLAAWSNDKAPENDESLLSHLTDALCAALADATDVKVESNQGYGTSDGDVPSVALHRQNEHRGGFHLIVRVLADIWTRLALKDPALALERAELWRTSRFRLMRRLAMFAFANRAVPGDTAADLLLELPSGELFLTSSSVEAYRLIYERWPDFSAGKQQQILQLLCKGPPRSWFREGPKIDSYIDRSCFDILSYMVQEGFEIGREGQKRLEDIRAHWPQWQPKPPEQAGFHVWRGCDNAELSGTDNLQDVPDDKLVAEAKRIAVARASTDGDVWEGLCLSDPDRALRGLHSAAEKGDWPHDYWAPLLWSRKAYADVETERKVAQLLREWPQPSFGRIAKAASSWLMGHAKTLSDPLLWSLWDRIADMMLMAAEPDNV